MKLKLNRILDIFYILHMISLEYQFFNQHLSSLFYLQTGKSLNATHTLVELSFLALKQSCLIQT